MAGKFIINLKEAETYTDYEGLGQRDLLTQDGMFETKIDGPIKFSATTGKTKGDMLTARFVVINDADNTGKGVIVNVMLSGVDSKNNPMSRQFFAMLRSSGMPIEAVRTELSKNGAVDAEALCQAIGVASKTYVVEVEYNEYEGRAQSEFRNFITPEQYAKSKAANAHRREHRKPVGVSLASGAVVPLPGVLNLGGAPSIQTPSIPGLSLGGLHLSGTPATPSNGAIKQSGDPLANLAGLSGLR